MAQCVVCSEDVDAATAKRFGCCPALYCDACHEETADGGTCGEVREALAAGAALERLFVAAVTVDRVAARKRLGCGRVDVFGADDALRHIARVGVVYYSVAFRRDFSAPGVQIHVLFRVRDARSNFSTQAAAR